jgi:predicted O-methyltransferase YrrM
VSILKEYEQRLAEWSDIQQHMAFMRGTAASYAVPRIIELGVRGGNSTSAFLAAAGEVGGELWSVDIAGALVPDHWHDLPYWHFLKAGDCSPEALAWLPLKCDVLFVDTSHTQEHTRHELEVFVPRVRRGGVALLHDTMWEDPAEELEEPTGPVARALDAFCRDRGLSWENRRGSYGLGVVRL